MQRVNQGIPGESIHCIRFVHRYNQTLQRERGGRSNQHKKKYNNKKNSQVFVHQRSQDITQNRRNRGIYVEPVVEDRQRTLSWSSAAGVESSCPTACWLRNSCSVIALMCLEAGFQPSLFYKTGTLNRTLRLQLN
jgi:hypothetical protein